MVHRKIVWCCDKCNSLQVSDSEEHHLMDFCKCPNHLIDKSGIDLEEDYCRSVGNPRIIAELKEGGKWELKNGKI